MTRKCPATRPALAALLLVLGTEAAWAVSADEYLFTPTVTQGEREIDWHFGTGSSGETTAAQSETGLALGAGVTQHWFTEFDIEYRKQSPAGTRLDAFEWENIFQIGEPGQWPVDIGMVFNVEKPYANSWNSAQDGGVVYTIRAVASKGYRQDSSQFQSSHYAFFSKL